MIQYKMANTNTQAIQTWVKWSTIWKWDISAAVSLEHRARIFSIFCFISASLRSSFSKYLDPLLISYTILCTFSLSTPSIPSQKISQNNTIRPTAAICTYTAKNRRKKKSRTELEQKPFFFFTSIRSNSSVWDVKTLKLSEFGNNAYRLWHWCKRCGRIAMAERCRFRCRSSPCPSLSSKLVTQGGRKKSARLGGTYIYMQRKRERERRAPKSGVWKWWKIARNCYFHAVWPTRRRSRSLVELY